MSPSQSLMESFLVITGWTISSLLCLSTEPWSGPILEKRCTPCCAGLIALQVADLRNSYFQQRKAKLFNKDDPGFENYTFFDTPNQTQNEMRRTIIGRYLKTRPHWYERLQRKKRKLNIQTKSFIQALLAARFKAVWRAHKEALVKLRKHSESSNSHPINESAASVEVSSSKELYD